MRDLRYAMQNPGIAEFPELPVNGINPIPLNMPSAVDGDSCFEFPIQDLKINGERLSVGREVSRPLATLTLHLGS